MFIPCIFLKFAGFDVKTAVTSAMLMLMNLHWSLMYEQLQFVMVVFFRVGLCLFFKVFLTKKCIKIILFLFLKNYF